MFKIIICSIISCFFYSQTLAQASKVDSSEMRTLRIDPNNAKGATASQIFEEVNYIPLETTKESLFGAITQLRVTKDRYIIWDYDTKAILLFTKQGKYIGKINASKMAKHTDDNLSGAFFNFTLKRDSHPEVIQVMLGEYVYFFDLNASLIRKINNEEYDGFWNQNKLFSDGTEVSLDYSEKKDKVITNYEISILKSKKKVESYFPYASDRYKTDPLRSTSLEDYGVHDELFFIKPYDYNVYRVTPKKLSIAYRLIFPTNNTIPSDFMVDPVYVGKRDDYFAKHPTIFQGIRSAYQIGNNFYFNVEAQSTSDVKKALIYNLKKNTLISIADIEPDALSQFLPVTDAGVSYEFTKGFYCFDKEYFYTSYSSIVMFNFKEQSEHNNRKYDPALTDYFKTQNRKSNPVLIQLKPRKD